MGSIVVRKGNVDDLVKVTQKFYHELKRDKDGAREIRELHAIGKGQLLQHPEYIAKKKK